MKLIEPKVELLSEEGVTPEQHIARCARTCYGHESKLPNQEADKKMVDGLIKRGHLSMLRQSSVYYSFPYEFDIPEEFKSEYVNKVIADNEKAFISTNRQFLRERSSINYAVCSPTEFLEVCKRHPEIFSIFRLTFCITTQISTSRELNRVSPNNISERSTRYCSSKDGLEICKPWWWNEDWKDVRDPVIYHRAYYSQKAWGMDELYYKELIENGMKPEDARGVLPLDTATKVIYTYSIQEWRHIIDLRYYGTTGTPHPNAKLVIGMVREQINEFAKAHNVNYEI